TYSVTNVAGVTYNWAFSGTGTITGSGNSISLSATTSGTLSVTASNSCGTSTARTQAITVNPNLPVSVTIATTSNPTCYGVEAVFTATPTNAGGTPIYQWRLNGSNIGSNLPYYSNTSLVNDDIITCILTSSETCTSGNPATSNTITMSVTTPASTGLTDGDYIWSGNTSTDWENASNWLVYSGSAFTVATVIPDNTKNVFLRDYSPCASNISTTSVSNPAECNNITIETGLNLSNASQLNVYGNWTNSGTFNANQGLVNFRGSNIQTITTNGDSFYDISFNNTNAGNIDIKLMEDIRVTHSANFTNGIVGFENTIRKFIFESSATSNEGTTTSFVDGIVEKQNQTAAFTFPTGDVNTRDIGDGIQTYKISAPFTANPEASTTVSVLYLFSNQGLNEWWYHDWTHEAPLTHTSDREYWLVNSGSDLQATLYWRDNNPCSTHDFCSPGPTDFESTQLTVAYWDNIWKDAGGTATTNYQNGYITSSTNIPFGAKGVKQITFGAKGSDMPLPVELVDFSATCLKTSANIHWQTATETNNDYFILEKSNGKDEFYEIARIKGAGNSNQLVDYQFVDDKMFSGDNYYRLIQVDYDGKVNVHNIISLNCDGYAKGQSIMYAYPNPFKDELNVVIENIDEGEFTIELFDDLGRVVYLEKCTATSSDYRTSIKLNNLRPAVYNLRSRTEENVLNIRVVKK
ncbi:MAG: T9SS type A sorting domain-containing protein, partial [Bacteroidales bacterium]|nr:T9SS type A sorting domain-containing protein [Bacteroidales bacterium]